MTDTTGDELLDTSKQDSLEIVKKNILDMLEKGTDRDRGNGEPEDLEDISLEDFDDCIYLLSEDILKKDNGRVIYYTITDSDLLLSVHYHLNLDLNSYPLLANQKIYYVEKDGFCATVYALETESKNVRFLVEPFEDSPIRIQELKEDEEERVKNKKNLGRVEQKRLSPEEKEKGNERTKFFKVLDKCKKEDWKNLHEIFEESDFEDIDKYLKTYLIDNNKKYPKKPINLRKSYINGEEHFSRIKKELDLPDYNMSEDEELPIYYLLMQQKIFVILPMLDENFSIHTQGIELALTKDYGKIASVMGD